MMLSSGNDAANTAAIAHAGSLSAFGDKMNEKAAQIGMKNTHFVTPSGLDAENHYSTAYDMALLTAYALNNPTFCKIAGSASAAVTYGNPPYRRTLKNHNRLLTSYEGCIGVKTGFTKKSGRCLVSAATRNGATLICVTLSAPDDWQDHKNLLDYGFSQMEEKEIPSQSLSLPVVGGTSDNVTLQSQSLLLSLPKGIQNNLVIQRQVSPFVYAPLSSGQKVGEVAVMYEGKTVTKIPLTAMETIPQNTRRPNIFVRIWQAFLRLFC
jgi:D-alanyl-D-alanine carboxypeptidase/D-alanyl-D-alanine carboxypeptidase (penicillin-binding protein 5/6)